MSQALGTPRLVRIAIVDDYELVVQGVRQMLTPWSDQVKVVELDVRTVPRQRVDIALFDMFRAGPFSDPAHAPTTPRGRGRQDGRLRLALHTTSSTSPAETGVSGVISKRLPAQQVVDALLDVAAGHTVIALNNENTSDEQTAARPTTSAHHGDWPGREYGLTMREAEMISLITLGFSNTEIAKRVYVSTNTVKTYIRAAYRKIGVTRRSQAVAWGLRHHMTPNSNHPTPRK